jgi:hypothetical protein
MTDVISSLSIITLKAKGLNFVIKIGIDNNHSNFMLSTRDSIYLFFKRLTLALKTQVGRK